MTSIPFHSPTRLLRPPRATGDGDECGGGGWGRGRVGAGVSDDLYNLYNLYGLYDMIRPVGFIDICDQLEAAK